MNDVIGEYARLTLYAEQLQRSGQSVPVGVVRRIQAIESTARTRLTPAQLNEALHHVEVAKMRMLTEQQTQQREASQRDMQQRMDRTTREMTRGWLGARDGLTPEQYGAVLDGKPLVFPRARGTQAEVDARFRAQTGMTEDEYVRVFDELASADDKTLTRRAQELRTTPEHLRAAVDRWKNGEGVAHGLMKRRFERQAPERPITPDADTRRRAHVVDAFLKHSVEERNPDLIPTDRVRSDSLADDSSRGHVARAMEAVERGVDVDTVSREVGYRREA